MLSGASERRRVSEPEASRPSAVGFGSFGRALRERETTSVVESTDHAIVPLGSEHRDRGGLEREAPALHRWKTRPPGGEDREQVAVGEEHDVGSVRGRRPATDDVVGAFADLVGRLAERDRIVPLGEPGPTLDDLGLRQSLELPVVPLDELVVDRETARKTRRSRRSPSLGSAGW